MFAATYFKILKFKEWNPSFSTCKAFTVYDSIDSPCSRQAVLKPRNININQSETKGETES